MMSKVVSGMKIAIAYAHMSDHLGGEEFSLCCVNGRREHGAVPPSGLNHLKCGVQAL